MEKESIRVQLMETVGVEALKELPSLIQLPKTRQGAKGEFEGPPGVLDKSSQGFSATDLDHY
jgi:hypothetical protein